MMVFAPAAFYFSYKNSTEMVNSGTEVECTVVAYQKFGRHVDVQVEYYDKDGNVVTADCIYNKPSPYLGEKLTGYVDESDPYSVYSPPSLFVGLLGGSIAAVIFILGALLVFGTIKGNSDDKLLDKSGIFIEGEVIEVTMMKDANKRLVYPAKLKFVDSDGDEQIVKQIFERRPPDIGEKIMLCYAKKTNGKIVSDLSKNRNRQNMPNSYMRR